MNKNAFPLILLFAGLLIASCKRIDQIKVNIVFCDKIANSDTAKFPDEIISFFKIKGGDIQSYLPSVKYCRIDTEIWVPLEREKSWLENIFQMKNRNKIDAKNIEFLRNTNVGKLLSNENKLSVKDICSKISKFILKRKQNSLILFYRKDGPDSLLGNKIFHFEDSLNNKIFISALSKGKNIENYYIIYNPPIINDTCSRNSPKNTGKEVKQDGKITTTQTKIFTQITQPSVKKTETLPHWTEEHLSSYLCKTINTDMSSSCHDVIIDNVKNATCLRDSCTICGKFYYFIKVRVKTSNNDTVIRSYYQQDMHCEKSANKFHNVLPILQCEK